MEDAATRSPEEAFGLVANETRIAILQALWEADERALSFSALRDRVGIRDTGQFNYHLGKLVGTFVEKVETGDCEAAAAEAEQGVDGDGGYKLRYAGLAVLGSILSGVYTHEATVGPVSVTESCLECDGGLEVVYEDEVACYRCRDCERRYNVLPLPPAVVAGRDPADLPELVTRYLYTVITQVSAGFCPICSGELTHRAVEKETVVPGGQWHAVSECRRCGIEVDPFLCGFFVGHPAVSGFFYEHGIDLRVATDVDSAVFRHGNETVVNEDPLRIEVPFELDDETLVVTTDEALDVVDIRRE